MLHTDFSGDVDLPYLSVYTALNLIEEIGDIVVDRALDPKPLYKGGKNGCTLEVGGDYKVGLLPEVPLLEVGKTNF